MAKGKISNFKGKRAAPFTKKGVKGPGTRDQTFKNDSKGNPRKK